MGTRSAMNKQAWKEWYQKDPEKATEYIQQRQLISNLQSSKMADSSIGEKDSGDIAPAMDGEEYEKMADYSKDGEEASDLADASELDDIAKDGDELSTKDKVGLGLQAGSLALSAYSGAKERQEKRRIAEYEARLRRNQAMQAAAGGGANWFR